MRNDLIETDTPADIFFRTAGAPLVRGNAVRVLCDAEENYPAWIEAIESARDSIHLEMYIVHNDRIGRRFRDLLADKAREGVEVRVLYDWFGSLRWTSFGFWRPLVAAGAEVRVANPPRFDTVLGLVSRDHRKLLCVDGRVAYVSGLCIGDAWMGDEARGIPPWRDTGVEIVGPAVAEAVAAFAAAWRLWGDPMPPSEQPRREEIPEAGSVDLRVVATSPESTALYRTDLSVVNSARERVWLTDAYFIVTPIYREALCSAAEDGVDIRILVPHTSDVQWIANYSRTQYRRLLEAGVRIFEWNGPMVHAKTAVVDGRWSRVGSSNLNASSWVGNWELDITLDDEEIAHELEEIFLEDLTNATEIIITSRNKVRRSAPEPLRAPWRRRRRKLASGSARVVKDVRMVGSMLDAAVKGHRVLERTAASTLLFVGAVFFVLAALVVAFPHVLVYPVAVFLVWFGLSFVVQAVRLRNPEQQASSELPETSAPARVEAEEERVEAERR